MLGLGDRRRLVEHARELLQRRGRALELRVELAQVLHRLEEAPQVQEERREHADGHVALRAPARRRTAARSRS